LVDFRAGTSNFNGGIGRVEIAVAPSDLNTLYITASGGNDDDSSSVLWTMRSNDNGENWTELPVPPDYVEANGTHFGRNGQAYYDLALAVDPNDPNTLIYGQVTQYKSTNGGAAWNEISAWYNNSPLCSC